MDVKLSPTLGLFFFVLTACGGNALDVDSPQQGGSGGGNQAGAPTAGTAHGGTSGSGQGGTGAGGSTMGGVGSGGSGDACSAYDDDTPGFIPVKIINETSSPIHLGQELLNCGVEPLFDVTNDTGRLGPGGSCRTSCNALRTGGPVGCPAICAYPSTLTLSPGEVYETSWDALSFVESQLPAECDVGYGRACTQARRIGPGKFTFSANSGSSIDCSGAPNGICEACQPLASGGCMTPSSLIGGTLMTADTTVLLDGAYGIYGASPAPGPAMPGLGAPPLPQVVKIIFGGIVR